MSAADRLIEAATSALVEAARAAGREDRDAVLVWIAAADAAVTLAEGARAREAVTS